MPPKRKAGPVGGPSKTGKASVTSTPGPATPKSIGSSDQFSDDDASETEVENLDRVIHKFSLQADAVNEKPVYDSVTHIFGQHRDFSHLRLRPDHASRPLWIDPSSGLIILEGFNPLFGPAQEFLITIAEPQSRPTFLHEYKLTSQSLYAAVSVGLQPKDIIDTLKRFLKTDLPKQIHTFIRNCTNNFGKVKLVLKNNKYLLESGDPAILQRLLKDPVIAQFRTQAGEGISTTVAPKMGALVIPGTKNAAGVNQAKDMQGIAPSQPSGGEVANGADLLTALNEDDEDDDKEAVHSFEIQDEGKEMVVKQCLTLELPVLEEYDFRNDNFNPDLDIDLRPGAQIRPYQEKSLSKMFGNGRAKSGIIVLPCGAGKTLVGITAACTVKKGVIVLCTSSMSVVQWRQEFLKWSNINPEDIAAFTAESKTRFKRETGIIVTTYSMVSQARERAHDTKKMMDFLKSREWGLMLLDEVHVVPADIFRRVTSNIKTHSKLGLTATLLREDDKIDDLNFLIGPKLFEANWMELSQQGHIAKVQCAEVWCPMPTEFYDEYLKADFRKKQKLYITNPRKFQAAQYLINYHESRGDKIIVFADDTFALKKYATTLKKVYIYGETSQSERMRILENFQHNPEVNTLFLSKVGDTSLDLPEATVLIQISSHYGSRRQEAQRLGRILRAKRRNDVGFNAFFYSLVSKDTQEMMYSSRRQAFLVDQGYAFKVITQLHDIDKTPDLAFRTAGERRELLQEVLLLQEKDDPDEITDNIWHSGAQGRKATRKSKARRTAGMLKDLAGGQDMAYVEQNRSANKALKKNTKKQSNAFFKKIQRENERRAKAI